MEAVYLCGLLEYIEDTFEESEILKCRASVASSSYLIAHLN